MGIRNWLSLYGGVQAQCKHTQVLLSKAVGKYVFRPSHFLTLFMDYYLLVLRVIGTNLTTCFQQNYVWCLDPSFCCLSSPSLSKSNSSLQETLMMAAVKSSFMPPIKHLQHS